MRGESSKIAQGVDVLENLLGVADGRVSKMKKLILIISLIPHFGFANEALPRHIEGALCFVKEVAPQYIEGEVPFDCDGKAEYFAGLVREVAKETYQFSNNTLIPNLGDCLSFIGQNEGVLHVASSVWNSQRAFSSERPSIAAGLSSSCKHYLDESHEQTEAPSHAPNSYVSSLAGKYQDRVSFHSAFSELTVKSFHIDCGSPDGRYLPLLNVLYARVASMDSDSTYLITDIVSRGNEVRIYDTLIGKAGAMHDPSLAFEINRWGELNPVAIRREAVMNACFGSYGEIWVVPVKE